MTRDLQALVAFIEARTAMPHDFDGNCCVRYVLGAVEAQFGNAPDPGASWRTERGALRAIAKLGGIEATTDRLFAEVPIGEARFGDIAGVDDPARGFHVMLVEGQMLSCPGERGLERLPRRLMVRAWSAVPLSRQVAAR